AKLKTKANEITQHAELGAKKQRDEFQASLTVAKAAAENAELGARKQREEYETSLTATKEAAENAELKAKKLREEISSVSRSGQRGSGERRTGSEETTGGISSEQPGFPNAAPAFQPRYIPETTRQKRQVDMIQRNIGGNLPHLRRVVNPTDGSGNDRDSPGGRGEEHSSEDEEEGEVTSRKGKGKGKAKKGSRLQEILGSDKRTLKGLLKELLTEMDMVLQALAREIFRISTGLNRAADFIHYEPATDEQVAQCGEANGERPVPGVSPFYFGKGFQTCMWNDMLLRGLVGDLRKQRAEDPNCLGIPDVSTDYLIALFLNHLREGRLVWARLKPHLGESVEMAEARAQQFDRLSKQSKSLRGRKETKWNKRTATAKKMMLLSARNPEAVQIWKWVKRLIELLGTTGMSSEDAKPNRVRIGGVNVMQTTHVIRVCAWRPEKVTAALELVDRAAEQISLKSSTTARPRIRGGKISSTLPPQGLPKALYDEQWMEDGLDMDSDFMDDLDVSEEAFELMELVAADLGLNEDEDMG
ncbi:hypothetical protein K438DRAFT_2005114, partial [Mycena galopus ATCC 62051]